MDDELADKETLWCMCAILVGMLPPPTVAMLVLAYLHDNSGMRLIGILLAVALASGLGLFVHARATAQSLRRTAMAVQQLKPLLNECHESMRVVMAARLSSEGPDPRGYKFEIHRLHMLMATCSRMLEFVADGKLPFWTAVACFQRLPTLESCNHLWTTKPDSGAFGDMRAEHERFGAAYTALKTHLEQYKQL